VLRTGCREQCFAHAACPLPAARRTRNAAVSCVFCCISHVLASSCMPSVVCCTLSVARVAWFTRLLPGVCCRVALFLVACCQWCFPNSSLHVACCTLPVARCMLHVALHVVVVRCMLLEVWRMLPVRDACRLLFAAYCPLHAACCLDVACCTLHVVSCTFPVARCMSSVAFSVMHVACSQLSVARFPVVIGGTLSVGSCLLHVLRCMSHVLRCPWSVACIPPPCPTSHGVCCLSAGPRSPLVTLHVAALRVVCRMLQTARPLVACCLLSVACRMPPVARCRVTQRRHTRSASRRRSQFRAQWPARPAADRGARACVRACVARVWVARVTVSLRVGSACVGWIRAKAIQ